MREYRVGDVVQVTKSGKHNGKIGVIVAEKIWNTSGGNFDKCHVSFDLNEVPLEQTYDFYNTRNGVNSSWYNTSNVEYATYNDANNYLDKFHGYYYRDYDVYYGEFVSLKKKATLLSRYAVSVSSDDTKLQGEMLSDKYFCINEVDREKLVNAMHGAIQFKKEDPLYKDNRKLKQRIQELEEELDNAYFDVAERKRYKRLKEESECLLQECIDLQNELLIADKEFQECREKFQSSLEDITKGTILLREYETVVTKGYASNNNNDLVFITKKYANGELIEVLTEDVE